MTSSEKILYVDDDPQVLTAFARTLKRHGITVDTAGRPDAAAALANEQEYAVIATDYMMPDVNGLDLIDRLRRLAPHATYMVVSGQCDLEVAAEAINEHGIANLITKPWDADQLVFMVRRGIEGYWERKAHTEVQGHVVERTRTLEEQKKALEEALARNESLMAETLLNALDLRTRETRAHCRRVAAYAQLLAHEVGLRGAVLTSLQQGALLHDVGKIGVPDAILRKPGPLTEEEWKIMRSHSAMGARIMEGFAPLATARAIVLQHHERWDGSGYPHGLTGDEILVEARILAVADTIDAILSNRPYRAAGTMSVVEKEVIEGSGRQFDPKVVEAYLRLDAAAWQQVREIHPDDDSEVVRAA